MLLSTASIMNHFSNLALLVKTMLVMNRSEFANVSVGQETIHCFPHTPSQRFANVFKLIPHAFKTLDIYSQSLISGPPKKVMHSVECSKTKFFMGKFADHLFHNSLDQKTAKSP